MYIKATNKLISKIIESLFEKDIYKNIGAEDFFSNKNDLDVYFRNMFSLQQPKVLKGYKYCYYYFKTSSNIEFIMTVKGFSSPNSANFVGMDMHFCSNSRYIGDIEEVIDRNKSAAHIIVADQVGNNIHANLMCADLLPRLTVGEEIKSQAIVYPEKIFVHNSVKDWEEAEPKNVSFELGLLTLNTAENSFSVSSEVLDVFCFTFKANSKEYKFYEIVVGNALGVQSALVTSDMLNTIPQKGNIVDIAVKHFMIDCAVKEYKAGKVVENKYCADIIIDALASKDVDRICASVSKNCKYEIVDANGITAVSLVDISKELLNLADKGLSFLKREIEAVSEILPESYIKQETVIVEISKEEAPFVYMESSNNEISKILIDKANNITPKSPFTEDEYYIIDALRYVGASKEEFMGTMLLLNEDKERSDEIKAKFVKYLKLKGKYVTQQDILKMSQRLSLKREQYYPCELYVRYLGETSEGLTKDKIYHVDMVFDCDEVYLIRCDDLRVRELSSALFQDQKVTKIEYVGATDEDGKERITIGFEKNKVYKVESTRMGEYTCEGGIKCMLDEVVPVEFEKAEEKKPRPLRDMEEAIRILRDAIEFNSLHLLAPHIHPNCKYISQPANKEFNTKHEFIERWRKVGEAQLEQDFFLDCAIGTVTKSDETNMFPAGTRCIAMYEEDGCKDVAFLTLSEDKVYITGIYILSEIYEFKLDPQECDKEE